MATKVKAGASKGANKRSTKPSTSGSSSKNKKTTPIKTAAKQHKPAPRTTSLKDKKRKPPHLRYSETELKVPQLNGIRPAGVQKLPNKKKGKVFTDDGDGMKMILAMVMAEKEGNIESKMMRARQMEEVREARRAEAEKRAEGKKAGLEDRKEEIRTKKRQKRKGVHEEDGMGGGLGGEENRTLARKPKKKVSFG